MVSGGRNWRRAAEIGFAGFMLAVSAAVWWSSFSLPPAMLEPIGPASFPRAVAAILALLALAVLAEAFFRRPPAERPAPAGAGRLGLAAVTLVLTVAYLGAMELELLGFRDATVVYLLALGAALVDFDRRRLLPVAAIAVCLGVGAHYVFTDLFFIDLPS